MHRSKAGRGMTGNLAGLFRRQHVATGQNPATSKRSPSYLATPGEKSRQPCIWPVTGLSLARRWPVAGPSLARRWNTRPSDCKHSADHQNPTPRIAEISRSISTSMIAAHNRHQLQRHWRCRAQASAHQQAHQDRTLPMGWPCVR